MSDKAAQFKILPNGPLEVSGTFELMDAKGELITKQGPLYLCRCGESSDKPFCDGSHRASGFSG